MVYNLFQRRAAREPAHSEFAATVASLPFAADAPDRPSDPRSDRRPDRRPAHTDDDIADSQHDVFDSLPGQASVGAPGAAGEPRPGDSSIPDVCTDLGSGFGGDFGGDSQHAEGDPDADSHTQSAPTLLHIGRYALKSRLGEGGLGQVHEAWDPLLSRTVAVKTLQFTLDEPARVSLDGLFLNEARAAGGLSHAHIVTVFDAGLSALGVYIAL